MIAPEPDVPSKAELRRDALARRDAIAASVRAEAAERIASRPFPVPIAAGACVSGFFPLRSEINALPLMRRLAEAGAKLALPVIVGRGNPLLFRAWSFGAPLGSGVWGIREPLPDAPQVFPDVLLVPLAAFDRHGYRIGYGGGYYDLTLHGLRAMKPVTAIGLAFAAQEIARVPASSHDETLDLVLTESEVIDCRETRSPLSNAN